jgi:hypothetical protein
VSAAVSLHPRVDGVAAHPRMAPAVVALARVEGRRLITHPAIIVTIALAVVQSVPFLLSRDATSEHDVGWILQVSAGVISLGALLAANLLALKSRRDGSEELFRSAPLSPAARTVALALAAVWVMAMITLFLLAGDVAIRAAGRGAATDSGRSLFPLFDLVQGPLMMGLFVLFGIAVARWVPRAFAGPVAVVGLFVMVNVAGNAADDASWLRLVPFGPRFLDDRAGLEALHVAYLVGLAAAVLALALLRFGWTRGARAWLAGGLGVAVVTGALQLVF